MTNDNRHPSGTPVGGQFAPGARPGADASVELTEDSPPHPLYETAVARAKDAAERASRAHSEQVGLQSVVAAMEIRKMAPTARMVQVEVADMQGNGSEAHVYTEIDAVLDADGNDLTEADPDLKDNVLEALYLVEDALGWRRSRVGAVHTFDVDLAISDFEHDHTEKAQR